MKPLIILRPEPGASATAKAARALGLKPLLVPLFDVEPVAWAVPDDLSAFDGLLLTSANAVRHGGEQIRELRGLKTYCVGKATADAAREAGFDIGATGEVGVERLLASIAPGQRLLHLSGEDRTDCGGQTQRLTVITAYRAVELPPPPEIMAAGSVVALHSSRAAARFADIADGLAIDRSTVAIAAISPLALAAAGGGWLKGEAAAKPDDPSLLALAQSLCNNPA